MGKIAAVQQKGRVRKFVMNLVEVRNLGKVTVRGIVGNIHLGPDTVIATVLEGRGRCCGRGGRRRIFPGMKETHANKFIRVGDLPVGDLVVPVGLAKEFGNRGGAGLGHADHYNGLG